MARKTSTAATSAVTPEAVPATKRPYFMPDLRARRMLFDFLELTRDGGVNYKNGNDAFGAPVLIEHERERTSESTLPEHIIAVVGDSGKNEDALRSNKFNRRKRISWRESHLKAILHLVGSYVTRNEPTRYEDASKELDRIKITDWMSRLKDDALKFKEAWIGWDAAKIDATGTISVAEAATIDPKNKGKAYVVMADPRRVVDFDELDGVVTRVVFEESEVVKASLTEPRTVKTFFKEWTKTKWERWELRKQVTTDGNQTTEDVLVPAGGANHSFGRCPWIRVCLPYPTDEIADLERALFNVLSWLSEELSQNTFTQRVITGAKPAQISGTNRGAGDTLVLEDSDADLKTIGSIPEQAASLIAAANLIREAIYMTASMQAIGTKNVAEAAEKKRMDMEGLYTVLMEIVDVIEHVENELLVGMEIIRPDEPTQRTKYSREFDMLSITELVDRIKAVASLPYIPAAAKRKLSASLLAKLDPFGPLDEYKDQQEEISDVSPELLDSIAVQVETGATTGALVAKILGVPESEAAAVAEQIDAKIKLHSDPLGGVDPNADPNEPSGGDPEPTEPDDEPKPKGSNDEPVPPKEKRGTRGSGRGGKPTDGTDTPGQAQPRRSRRA